MSSGSECGVEPFEVIWLNINGINSNKSESSFYLLIGVLLRSNYSIMFLQEPRLKEDGLGTLRMHAIGHNLRLLDTSPPTHWAMGVWPL